MLYIRFQTVETDNRQTKGIFFLKKVIRKFGPRNFVPSPPQIRRQVSATDEEWWISPQPDREVGLGSTDQP